MALEDHCTKHQDRTMKQFMAGDIGPGEMGCGIELMVLTCQISQIYITGSIYESIATVGEIRVWWRADFQSGSRVLKKVF